MKKILILIISLFYLASVQAQVTLTIRQAGTKERPVPELTLVDYEAVPYKKVNDTTFTYVINIKNPESLFIGINPETGWFTRVWLDPKFEKKDVTIDYAAHTTLAVINPSKEDSLFEKVFSYLKSNDRREPDSIAGAYVAAHPSSWLSLYFVSHGLYRNEPQERIAAFNSLSPVFKDHPDYEQIRAILFDRKYAVEGDSFKEFALTDIDNKIFSSTSLNDKWILLHFWSTGCIPCVKEMDSLVACYNSLDTTRITFISIGMDDKRENWSSSNATAKMKWTSLWQPGGGVGELCLHYGVTAMPYFILFNEQKKIVFIKYGSDELESIKASLISAGLAK